MLKLLQDPFPPTPVFEVDIRASGLSGRHSEHMNHSTNIKTTIGKHRENIGRYKYKQLFFEQDSNCPGNENKN
jgi:hypothetical protein